MALREAAIALALHQYQYNGADPEGVMSIYTSRAEAVRDICNLLGSVVDMLGDESLRQELNNACESV